MPLFSQVNGALHSGDILQIEGPNGCGKTTLLRMLAGSLSPTEGEICWQQQPTARCRQQFLRDVLFIGHQPAIKLELSPLENLRYWRSMTGCQPRLADNRALAQMKLVGYEDAPCYSLSAGQLRRAALARLLVSDARIWLLDEPFTAIDKQGVDELSGLIADHASQGGVVVLSTHQPLALSGLKRLALTAPEELLS